MAAVTPPPLFQPFRALGYITDDIPFAVQRRGKETFVTVSVGKAWQVRAGSKRRLPPIKYRACTKPFSVFHLLADLQLRQADACTSWTAGKATADQLFQQHGRPLVCTVSSSQPVASSFCLPAAQWCYPCTGRQSRLDILCCGEGHRSVQTCAQVRLKAFLLALRLALALAFCGDLQPFKATASSEGS
jgi:hypothetical protein